MQHVDLEKIHEKAPYHNKWIMWINRNATEHRENVGTPPRLQVMQTKSQMGKNIQGVKVMELKAITSCKREEDGPEGKDGNYL